MAKSESTERHRFTTSLVVDFRNPIKHAWLIRKDWSRQIESPSRRLICEQWTPMDKIGTRIEDCRCRPRRAKNMELEHAIGWLITGRGHVELEGWREDV